jgi:protein SCO1/2
MKKLGRARAHDDRSAWPLLILGALTFALAPASANAEGDQRSYLAHADGHDAHEHHRANADGQRKYERSVHVYKVPDVTLVDMAGAKVSLASTLRVDAPTFLNFIFTTCTSICPVMSATFAEVQRQLGADSDRVRMISISIDPEHDTPEKLRAFARRHDAGPQWRFLTGTSADIVAVQKAFDAYRGNKMGHEPFTFLRASAVGSWVRIDGLVGAADLVAEYRREIAK